jgi:DNA polymerase III alpha subunit
VDREFVEAHNSPENVKYINDLVQEVTEETHGFLIFQEQIAMLAHKLGRNLTLDEGNLLRKVLTKKGTGKGHEVKDAIHEKFVLGCQDKGMPLYQAEELWKTFEYFSGYGFNKSHAVSYSIISYQCAWLCHYYTTEWVASFLDKEPESRKEKAINLAKQHGYTIQPLSVNKSGRTWEILDETTLVAPLTTIKGLGDKAIDQILAHRPFETIEEFLFHDKIVYSKLNKKCLDALARAGAMRELQDDRFTGDKHFWTATCVDRPRKLKNLGENIEKYRPEGNFTDDERIDFLANLTGIFPINLVIDESIQRKLDQYRVPPISEYDPVLGMCWCIVREVTKKKTKNGKLFYVVDVIDNNSVQTRLRCWSVNPERDILYINRPYMIKPQHNDTWGFSTRGSLNRTWVMLG